MKTVTLTLQNEEGLHARPANLFSRLAMKLESDIQVLKNGNSDNIFNPKSILSILTMGAVKGDQLTIIANGKDEEEAILKITNLVKNDFKD